MVPGGIAELNPNINHITLMTAWSALTRGSVSSGFNKFAQTGDVPLRQSQ